MINSNFCFKQAGSCEEDVFVTTYSCLNRARNRSNFIT